MYFVFDKIVVIAIGSSRNCTVKEVSSRTIYHRKLQNFFDFSTEIINRQ
jgi:hypothetical protein